jgi:hypothetical protein
MACEFLLFARRRAQPFSSISCRLAFKRMARHQELVYARQSEFVYSGHPSRQGLDTSIRRADEKPDVTLETGSV